MHKLRIKVKKKILYAKICKKKVVINQILNFSNEAFITSVFTMGTNIFFIFKICLFFEMCFHFQNVKGFASVVFSFSEKNKCNQKCVHSQQIALLKRLWTNNDMNIKLLNLFQLSRIYNLSYLFNNLCLCYLCLCFHMLLWFDSENNKERSK